MEGLSKTQAMMLTGVLKMFGVDLAKIQAQVGAVDVPAIVQRLANGDQELIAIRAELVQIRESLGRLERFLSSGDKPALSLLDFKEELKHG